MVFVRIMLGGSVLALASAGAAGCGSDILDTDVDLMPASFAMDFGNQSGTIPTVPCDLQTPTACGQDSSIQLNDGAGQATVTFACDPGSARCFAQAQAHAAFTVSVLQDASFQSSLGRHATFLVRKLDLVISVPTNTTTFDVPAVDVYVGPPGALLPTDASVFFVGSVESIPAGAPLVGASARHLVLADGTPARAFAESNVKNQTPFVVIVAATPRLASGATVPAGMLQVDVQPVLTIGF